MEAQDLSKAIVRIFTVDDTHISCGTGFLISRRYIVTCAHVIYTACSSITNTQQPYAGQSVFVDFPFFETGQLRCTVVFFHNHNNTDLAILELSSPLPQQALPVTLKATSQLRDHPYSAFGFSEPEGSWTHGKLLGANSLGYVQMHASIDSWQTIEGGFSGAPVYDEKEHAIVGMVVSILKGEQRVAFMLPISRMLKMWSPLRDYLPQSKGEVSTTPLLTEPRYTDERWSIRQLKQIDNQEFYLLSCLQEDLSHPDIVQRCYTARPTQKPAQITIKQVAIRSTIPQHKQALLSLKEEVQLLDQLSKKSNLFPVLVAKEWLSSSVTVAYREVSGKPLSEAFRLVDKTLDIHRIRLLFESLGPLGLQLRLLHQQQKSHRSLSPDQLIWQDGRQPRTLLRGIGLATQPFRTGEGHPNYIAPEQKQGASVHIPGTDMYQLAALLYHLLVGETVHSFFYGIEPPTHRIPALPAEVDTILLQALEKDPTKRGHSIDSFCKALQNVFRPQKQSISIKE